VESDSINGSLSRFVYWALSRTRNNRGRRNSASRVPLTIRG
jgi:hypothetical protein